MTHISDAQLIEHLHARGWSPDKIDIAMIREACAALASPHISDEQIKRAVESVVDSTTWEDDDEDMMDDVRRFGRQCIERYVALAQPEASPTSAPVLAEPVAWRYKDSRGHWRYRGYVPNFDIEYSILKPEALYASPPAQEPPCLPTMDDAIAAGDGTLHGAIDYWQERALKAESGVKQEPPAVQDGAPKGCYPEEWGPSDDRRLTCACGNPDPAHWQAAPAKGGS